jgi:hypothetical protein
MKTLRFFAAIAMSIAAVLTSCKSVPDISGEWLSSQPAHLDVADGTDTQMLNRLIFTPDAAGSRTGKVTIKSDVNIVAPLPLTEVLVEPYQISITAQAMIDGTYAFDDGDDDELTIKLDQSSLKVEVSPLAQVSRENMLTQQQVPEVDAMKTAMIDKYKTLVERALSIEYGRFSHLEDLDLKNPQTLKFEIQDQDLYFNRVNNAE